MSQLAKQMHLYNETHQHIIVKTLHLIGVLLSLYALLIVFNWIHITIPTVVSMSLVWFAVLLACIYYLSMDLLIGLTMSVILIGLTFTSRWISNPGPTWFGFKVFAILMVVGLLFLLPCHLSASKRLTWKQHLGQIFATPLYWLAELFFLFGWKQDLKGEVDSK